MPKPHPREFRDDVVAVARRGEAPISQVAKDFGISESCLRNWLHAADAEDGLRPGTAAAESAEFRELKRRNRLLEQENEVLRRAAAYLSQANLPGNDVPARQRAGRRRDTGGGRMPGADARPPALLPLAHPPDWKS